MQRTITSQFEQIAESAPTRCAVEAGEVALSYEELNGRANRLARALLARGLQPGQLVGLELELNASLPVAILGVLKAGGVYLPLPLDYPAERRRLIKELADPALTVVENDATPSDSTVAIKECLRTCYSAANPQLEVDPQQALYVIFTSGTSGRPKGVRVSHQNLSRLFPEVDRILPFQEGERWSIFHSYGFGYFAWEMWGGLLHGATLVVVPRALTGLPDEFLDWLEEQRIQVLSLTPTAFRNLSRVAAMKEARSTWRHLRVIALSGEPVKPRYLRTWLDLYGDQQPELWSSYALTETCGQISLRRFFQEDLLRPDACPIGEVLSDVELWLLDDELNPVEEGEVVVGGPMLSLGYLGDSELTRERFFTLPISDQRVYRTGDLARRNGDGSLEFLGRKDRQVKIRGHRLELGEVESALADHPAVQDAVAFTRSNEGELTLLAGYVCAPGEHCPPQSLREYLRSLLPSAAVPEQLLELEVLPKDIHGKIATDQIAVNFASSEVDVGLYDAVEELLLALWRHLFPGQTVELDSDFFALGGHSLLALRMVGALRNDFGFSMRMRDLMECPRLRDLAQLLSTGQSSPLPERSQDQRFLEVAIAQARDGWRRGQPPYGACLVFQDEVVAAAYNQIWSVQDPTAHAEVLVLREAGRRLSSDELKEATLYSSCEPCSMCLSACHWAGVKRVVFAATMEDESRFGLSQPTVRAVSLAEELGEMEVVGPISREKMLDLFEAWLTAHVEKEDGPSAEVQGVRYTTDFLTNKVGHWSRILASYVDSPDTHFLEFGSFEGRSANWLLDNILTHPSSRLTCVDPFYRDSQELFEQNLQAAGHRDRVRKIVAESAEALTRLEKGAFDVVFIDGCHRAPEVMLDAVSAWFLLKDGGLMIFDDYLWEPALPAHQRPPLAIDHFLELMKDRLTVLHHGYDVIVRKEPSKARPDFVEFDPFAKELREDPHGYYSRLRNHQPVHQSPYGMWLLTGYNEIVEFLNSSGVSNRPMESSIHGTKSSSALTVTNLQERLFFFLEGEKHTRYRKLAIDLFRRELTRVEATTREQARRLIETFLERDEVELVSEYAFPLVRSVVGTLLGLPEEDQERLGIWARSLASIFSPALDESTLRELNQAVNSTEQYLRDWLSHSSDSYSPLVESLRELERDQEMTRDEVVAFCLVLLSNGVETVIHTIVNAAWSLLNDPEQLTLIRREPELWPQALEELLRFQGPAMIISKNSGSGATVGGVEIPPQQSVYLVVGAANRDPEIFSNPESLDIRRRKNAHLAFSRGSHACVGAALARTEARAAIQELIEAFPSIEVRGPAHWSVNITLRGLEHLTVSLGPK